MGLATGVGTGTWSRPSCARAGTMWSRPTFRRTTSRSELDDYADAVVAAVGDRRELIVVAQSFGGFTAPLVAVRLPVDALVFVTAMVPSPGEAPDDWWQNTGYRKAVAEQAARDGGATGNEDPYVCLLSRRAARAGRAGAEQGAGAPVGGVRRFAVAARGSAGRADAFRPLLPRTASSPPTSSGAWLRIASALCRTRSRPATAWR